MSLSRTTAALTLLIAVNAAMGCAQAGDDATKPAAPPAAEAPAPAKKLPQAADGSVLLHAKDVTIHGSTVRYEPQPHKNTIGFWTKKEDWVSWEFELATPGTFKVVILQGCGKGSGGAEYEVSVGGQTLKGVVEDTGHFQNFKEKELGTVTLAKAGSYTFAVKPLTKPGVAVMDLRQVTLVPVK